MDITPQFLAEFLRMATQMRTDMMNDLTDTDLAVRVPGNPTLGEVCRDWGNVERFYLNSFKTGRLNMDRPEDVSTETATSVQKLKAWYQALDNEFEAVLTAIPNSEFATMTVERSGRNLPAGMHYHTYHEAILIFCAKCSVYLRMMGKPLNDQWIDWIG